MIFIFYASFVYMCSFFVRLFTFLPGYLSCSSSISSKLYLFIQYFLIFLFIYSIIRYFSTRLFTYLYLRYSSYTCFVYIVVSLIYIFHTTLHFQIHGQWHALTSTRSYPFSCDINKHHTYMHNSLEQSVYLSKHNSVEDSVLASTKRYSYLCTFIEKALTQRHTYLVYC